MAHGARIWGLHLGRGGVVRVHATHLDAKQRARRGGGFCPRAEFGSARRHGPNLGLVARAHQQLDRGAKPRRRREKGHASEVGQRDVSPTFEGLGRA